MKIYFTYLLLICSSLTFGQIAQNQDYFIQFNGRQISNKVSIDAILNHSFVQKMSKSKFDINEYTSLLQLDKNITIHGNFSDSIPFYQITIPIKNRDEVKNLIRKKLEENNLKSDEFEINDYDSYSLFNSKKNAFTFAWNDENLVIFELLKPNQTDKQLSYAYEEEPVYVEEVYEEDEIVITESAEMYEVEEAVFETVEIEETVIETTDEVYNNEKDEEDYYSGYKLEIETEKIKRKERQTEYTKKLFENGFTIPFSEKVNKKADVSSWINYQSAFNSIKDFSGIVKSMIGGSRDYSSDDVDHFIRGVNFNMYFDNDNARVEQIIEYSKPLASIMNKVLNRKINKNIFKYFPSSTPLAFMSYHINSEELLSNFPSITEQLYSNAFLKKDEMEIITDLVSTILDEKAIATLFDGDFTFFLHDISQQEYKYMTYDYDENYEEIEVEKTDKKTIPIFTVLFTSTHKKMGTNLLNLAVKKGVFIKEKGYYKVKGTDKEMGDLRIIKDGDVMVISNGLSLLNNSNNSSFAKNFKNEIRSNYMYGNVNIKDLIIKYVTNENLGKKSTKMLKVSEQFQKMEFKSAKKIKDNKLQFEMSLQSSKSDKNIILQTLDVMEILD